jgi:hypothetical protein
MGGYRLAAAAVNWVQRVAVATAGQCCGGAHVEMLASSKNETIFNNEAKYALWRSVLPPAISILDRSGGLPVAGLT